MKSDMMGRKRGNGKEAATGGGNTERSEHWMGNPREVSLEGPKGTILQRKCRASFNAYSSISFCYFN